MRYQGSLDNRLPDWFLAKVEKLKCANQSQLFEEGRKVDKQQSLTREMEWYQYRV